MTSRERIPAELERGRNRPAGCGRGAHEIQFQFGVCLKAADQRVVPSPVRAGHASAISPASHGAFSKDPGSHSVVSSRSDVCRQPSRGATHHGLFLNRRQIARENLSVTKRHEPGSQALRNGTDRLPCFAVLHSSRMEKSHGKIAASEYVTARRGA